MAKFSAIVSMRIDSEDMDSAINEIEDYLMKNDYHCHLHYIVEEAGDVKQSNGRLMGSFMTDNLILIGNYARCGKTVRMQKELEKAKAAGKKVIVIDKEFCKKWRLDDE